MDIDLLPQTVLTQALLLLCAFVLSAVIGLERELRNKSAGTRTHVLVGVGSALFTLVSAYGFESVLDDSVVLDPSRIAAQVVTGIGFLGAGVIFVRQNIVSGLTTAASIWVTAAVGMAAGAGMPLIAALAVVLHLLTVTVLTVLVKRLPRSGRTRIVTVRYTDGRGVLRVILEEASQRGYQSSLRHTRRVKDAGEIMIEASLRFTHPQMSDASPLIEALSEVPDVQWVHTGDHEHD